MRNAGSIGGPASSVGFDFPRTDLARHRLGTATGVVITVRDYGQWRERGASMDRGRGSTLMSAFADVTAVPSPTGTTVVISSPLA